MLCRFGRGDRTGDVRRTAVRYAAERFQRRGILDLAALFAERIDPRAIDQNFVHAFKSQSWIQPRYDA